MQTLDWPNDLKRKRLNQIVVESGLNPFGLATYNQNEKISDFVGREEELERFKEQIRIVVDHQISRAVRLEGPAGVGKSTLFNFLKESIQKERQDFHSLSNYITDESDVLSTYFQIPDKIIDFQDIWIPMFDGLKSNFEEEVGYDISFLEYLVLKLVHRLLQQFPAEISDIIWSNPGTNTNPTTKPQNYQSAQISDIFDPLYEGGAQTVKKLQDFWANNARAIRKLLVYKTAKQKYEISRSDNQIINDLFRVLDENDPSDYLEQILQADQQVFKNNEDLINYFNNLMRYYAAVSQKRPLLLIGIDEAAKGPAQLPEEYYHGLGNLFVKLRNSLNHILFVFISTTQDWAQYDQAILKYTDLNNQISDFMYSMVLRQLEVRELIQVLKNRLNHFWENYSEERALEASYYPFSEQSFEYFYRYNRHDLRKTIQFLNGLWVKFRFQQVPKLQTYFDCMRFMAILNQQSLDPMKFMRFEWKIVRNAFLTKSARLSNSARSSLVECALEDAWRSLMSKPGSLITNVQNNMVIKTSHQDRRPDIFIEISGNLGAEHRRRVEFQVKAYQDTSEVKLEHIESSLELFDEKYIDFIYFIITGKGLSPDAEQQVMKIEHQYTNRIRRPPLNEKQKDLLYFLALFEEIWGKKIYSSSDFIPIAENCLSGIIGQNIYVFIEEITKLAKRSPQFETEEIIQNPKQDVSQIEKPSRDPFVSLDTMQPEIVKISDAKAEKDPSTLPQWCQEFGFLEQFFPELCGLAYYMKTRESGRYAWKFTLSTVEKNIIESDASLEKGKFKNLLKMLEARELITKVNTSYQFTASGKKLYYAIKATKYQYH